MPLRPYPPRPALPSGRQLHRTHRQQHYRHRRGSIHVRTARSGGALCLATTDRWVARSQHSPRRQGRGPRRRGRRSGRRTRKKAGSISILCRRFVSPANYSSESSGKRHAAAFTDQTTIGSGSLPMPPAHTARAIAVFRRRGNGNCRVRACLPSRRRRRFGSTFARGVRFGEPRPRRPRAADVRTDLKNGREEVSARARMPTAAASHACQWNSTCGLWATDR